MDKRLQEIYDEIPSVNCTGQCFQSCSFIGTFPAEKRNLRNGGIRLPQMEEAPCVHLDFAGRCSIYDYRPVICRLYGVSEDLACPFGCKPDRALTKPEAFELMRRVRELEQGEAT